MLIVRVRNNLDGGFGQKKSQDDRRHGYCIVDTRRPCSARKITQIFSSHHMAI